MECNFIFILKNNLVIVDFPPKKYDKFWNVLLLCISSSINLWFLKSEQLRWSKGWEDFGILFTISLFFWKKGVFLLLKRTFASQYIYQWVVGLHTLKMFMCTIKMLKGVWMRTGSFMTFPEQKNTHFAL